MSLAWRLQRFLDKHGVDYRSGKRAFVTTCLNPSCRKEDHCYIWKSDGGAICFRCDSKWRWRWMVAAISGCPISRAYEEFFGEGSGEEIQKEIDIDKLFAPDNPPDQIPEKRIVMPPDFIQAEDSPRAMEYLVRRGLREASQLYDYDLRYHALMDAVVFPVRKHGDLYGWQARRIDPKEKQLRLISHTFSKSKFLLNFDVALSYPQVALVEGPFDCLNVEWHEAGVAGVASLGKGVSRDQIKLLLDMPCEDIILGLDPDASEEVYEVVGRIGLGKKIYRIKPPEHRKDFGECSRSEIEDSYRRALPMSGQSDVLDVYLKGV